MPSRIGSRAGAAVPDRGLTQLQRDVLEELDALAPVGAPELSARLGAPVSSINGALYALNGRGLAVRVKRVGQRGRWLRASP